MLPILAAVAQLERTAIREPQTEGIAITKAKGAYAREPKLSESRVFTACKLVSRGIPKAVVVRELGVSRQTLYAALKSQWGCGTTHDTDRPGSE